MRLGGIRLIWLLLGCCPGMPFLLETTYKTFRLPHMFICRVYGFRTFDIDRQDAMSARSLVREQILRLR